MLVGTFVELLVGDRVAWYLVFFRQICNQPLWAVDVDAGYNPVVAVTGGCGLSVADATFRALEL